MSVDKVHIFVLSRLSYNALMLFLSVSLSLIILIDAELADMFSIVDNDDVAALDIFEHFVAFDPRLFIFILKLTCI